MKTVAEIAVEYGIPRWKLAYTLRTRPIPPQQRAGIVRLFDAATVSRIVEEARRIRPYRRREAVTAS
jgi:hypothetical protein